MEKSLSPITLGVGDLSVSRQFYVETLGWQPIAKPEGVVCFDIGGLVLALPSRRTNEGHERCTHKKIGFIA